MNLFFWTYLDAHLTGEIFVSKIGQITKNWGDLPADFNSGSSTQGAGAVSPMELLVENAPPLKGCFSPGESGYTCGVGEAKDEDEGVQCNYFWKQHSNIIWGPCGKTLEEKDAYLQTLFYSFIAEEAAYFHVFPILDAWFEMFCLFQVHVSPGRTTKICLQTCGYQTCYQARGDDMHWYALICDVWQGHVIKTCPAKKPEMQEMQDEFEDVLVEEPEDVPEANHCTPYCRCWYHFGLMLMLFRPGGITWITGRHRRALWRGMAFGCHHDIMYTLSTHIDTPWHDSRVTCPDGMKQLETVLPVAPVAERAWNFTVSIFKSSTCRLGGDVGRKSRRGDGVRSTGPGLIDFKILHTNLIGYFSMKFACDSETNSMRKFELHNRVWYG